MAKIRLLTLGIPKSTGELLQAVDSSSSSGYVAAGSGLDITELYLQQVKEGVLQTEAGEQSLIMLKVYIPKRHVSTVTLTREDKLVIDSDTYVILGIMNKFNSPIEDHYVCDLKLSNRQL